MPRSFIDKDMAKLGNIDLLHDQKLEQLAIDYGVSLQALTYRLNNLGYIPEVWTLLKLSLRDR